MTDLVPQEAYRAADAAADPQHNRHYGGECPWPSGLRAAIDAAAPLIRADALESVATDQVAEVVLEVPGGEMIRAIPIAVLMDRTAALREGASNGE